MTLGIDSGGITCPACGSGMAVKDSRPGTANSTRRRRMCLNPDCGRRYTTYECIYDSNAPLSDAQIVALLEQVSRKAQELQATIDTITRAHAAALTLQELRLK